jgi:hypothetical protein
MLMALGHVAGIETDSSITYTPCRRNEAILSCSSFCNQRRENSAVTSVPADLLRVFQVAAVISGVATLTGEMYKEGTKIRPRRDKIYIKSSN